MTAYPSLCVPATPGHQLAATRRLVRPEALGQVAAHLSYTYPREEALAEPVLRWMREQFASRRLQYIPDPERCASSRSADLWRSPVATFANGGGDCEDLSIVALSALHAFGAWDSWLVVGDAPGRHAWIEGVDELSGFLIEATAPFLIRRGRPAEYLPEYSYHPSMGLRVFAFGCWQPIAR